MKVNKNKNRIVKDKFFFFFFFVLLWPKLQVFAHGFDVLAHLKDIIFQDKTWFVFICDTTMEFITSTLIISFAKWVLQDAYVAKLFVIISTLQHS
jgi:hypothetical protein